MGVERGTIGTYPLTLHHIFSRMRDLHADKHIVTKTDDGLVEATYGDMVDRILRLVAALSDLGVGQGDAVGTVMMNSQAHAELYMAVPLMGAVLHTINPRLHKGQLAYIVNDAEDRVVVVDAHLMPAFDQVAGEVKTVEHLIVLGGGGQVATAHDVPVHDYEELVASHDPVDGLPEIDENAAAAACYTSGTTGDPKGVVYTHRSIYLHTFGVCLPDALGVREDDVLMPVVPQFHAMAWGSVHAALMVGADLVMPHRFLEPEPVAELLSSQKVTITEAVPTVWNGLKALLMQEGARERYDLSSLRAVVIGGSAVPEALLRFFEEEYDVPVLHAWGLTETSPIGTVARLRKAHADADEDTKMHRRLTQGRPVAGIDLRLIDQKDGETPAPWDGETVGEIEVRGPWVAERYGNMDAPERFHDGWLRTGDVAVMHPDGYIEIVDRTKDLIKSGGEWISSVELENTLMGHPDVLEAAVIAMPDEKWDERPMAVVVLQEGAEATADDLNGFLSERVAKFWLPDRYEFIDEIPKGATGKFSKLELRERFFGERQAAPGAHRT
ncbi:MAG: long-chain fatty acid--CoA ligase [Nitriliruptorales bacterium]